MTNPKPTQNFLSNFPGSTQRNTQSGRLTDQLSDLLTPLLNGGVRNRKFGPDEPSEIRKQKHQQVSCQHQTEGAPK